MTAPESRSWRALHFALGLLVSLAVSAVAVPLWIGGSIFMYFASLGNPFVLPGLILVPSVIAFTCWLVKNNPARIIGALTFYPLAALATYVVYDQTIGRDLAEERKAMELDYSSRTIAQPLGTIDILGLPLFAWPCHDTCAHILLNGIAKEVAGVSFYSTIDPRDATPPDKAGPPWVTRRHRLGRGEECLGPDPGMSGTGVQVQWIQSNGIFDVCIIISVGDSKLGNMILIDHGPHARRPYGPSFGPDEGAAVAYQVTEGRPTEIVRWEFGVYMHSGKSSRGERFTVLDFAKALSGRGETDRLANQYSMTLREAVERVHSHLYVMPNIDGWSPFEFLRKVHETELGRGKRTSIDADVAAKLKQLPGVICRERNRRVTQKQCIDRYNEVVGVTFSLDVAEELRRASEP